MRKALLTGAIVAIVLALAGPALATGTRIDWTGHGEDNLPCTDGAHWVLAPAFGVTAATLYVDGTAYTMHQNGNGSWAADSSGAIDSDVDAYVIASGDVDYKDHLQLSHCTDTSSPTPSETESPSPSETESPSPSETESPTPSETGTPESPTPSTTVLNTGHTPNGPRPTALTGANIIPWVAAGLALLGIGAAALRIGTRRES
jgi:hypothetical protein